MRYFTFDFDNDVVVEYEREGECNGCAACCTTLIRWKASSNRQLGSNPGAMWNPKNGDRYISEHEGVYTAVLVDHRWRFFRDIEITAEKIHCHALTSTNRCSIHLGKALISTAWPMSPEHVKPFPECSYTFREITRWPYEVFMSSEVVL